MHLLVIEDNPDLVENLCDFLESRGHTADVAYNGKTGLSFAQQQHYDVIILDLMLPGMDGLKVCGRYRTEGGNSPILMLTARDSLNDKLAGFGQGADDYLVKPFAMQELEVRLGALVKRGRTQEANQCLTVADLRFDPEQLRVERTGRRIELAPIPMRLLTLLMLP